MKTLLRGAATLLTAALLCRMQGGAGQAPPAQGETIPLPALDAVIAQAAVTYLKLCGFVLYFRLLAAGCGKAENDPTDQQQQQDPIMKTYGDDFFLAQAKAMGYTDEMIEAVYKKIEA